MSRTVDFSLHGVVGVRLVDPSEANIIGVARDTGLVRAALVGEPDVTIRFVDALDVGALHLAGLEAGVCAEGYVSLPPKHWSGGRSLLPLTAVGGRCEIVCERSVREVPLLIEVLNLTAAHQGLLPLHGAAFVQDGCGWVVTGWSKGGKTETLLAMAARGAVEVVGDEWVYLRNGEVRGTAHRMRLWDWQLDQVPELRQSLTVSQRRRLTAVRTVLRWHSSAAPVVRRSPVHRGLSMLMPTVEAQAGVYVEPGQVFPPDSVRDRAAVDRLLLVESTTDPQTSSSEVAPAEVAARMCASLEYERRDLRDAWLRLRHVQPEAVNPWLDTISAVEAEILHAAFHGLPTHVLQHPYPVELDQLGRAVEGLTRPHRRDGSAG